MMPLKMKESLPPCSLAKEQHRLQLREVSKPPVKKTPLQKVEKASP